MSINDILPIDVQQKYKNKKLDIVDIVDYPVLKDYVDESCFKDASSILVEKVGIGNVFKLIDDYSDLVVYITSSISKIDLSKFSINQSTSYEDLKINLCKYIINDYNFSFLKIYSLDDIVSKYEILFKIITIVGNIEDRNLERCFINYVKNKKIYLTKDKLDEIDTIIKRLCFSNSSRLQSLKHVVLSNILESYNPSLVLEEIEKLFLNDDLPYVGQAYIAFKMMYPDFKGIDFSDYSVVSPVLKDASLIKKNTIVFSDLLKASMGSNNRSLKLFVNKLKQGDKLFKDINNEKEYDKLSFRDKKILKIYCDKLEIVYNNSLLGKDNQFKSSGNSWDDINTLRKLFSKDGNIDYNLPDRIIEMFGYFIGIKSVCELEDYMMEKVKIADYKNRITAQSDLKIKKGDLIKGIDDKYLADILQNGNLTQELLGIYIMPNNTPLSIDFVKNLKDYNDNVFNGFVARYGTMWIVVKDSDDIIKTRRSPFEDFYDIDSTKDNFNCFEEFYTGIVSENHFCIRDGIASTDIHCIVVDDYKEQYGVEVAKNGFYIPIYNINGKIVFTPEDYDRIRVKMGGLRYYEVSKFNFSDNLINEDVKFIIKKINNNIVNTFNKKRKIVSKIEKSLQSYGLKLKTSIDGDLSSGFAELIDVGSTSRRTNKFGDNNFDFVLRLDQNIMKDRKSINIIKKDLLNVFDNDFSETNTGDKFRFLNVDGNNTNVSITFMGRTDKMSYSTDMALIDRLNSIMMQDREKYVYILGNILLAKEVLKLGNVYNPNQGGLGEVGIENWILQNGGSFIDSAVSFLKEAEDKTFDEFKYSIWDFGKNYDSVKEDIYPYDDFIKCNMNSDGYEKMKNILSFYLDSLNIDYSNKINIKKI